MVRGIDNIGICSADLERSPAFYGKLSLAEAYRNDRGVMMATGAWGARMFGIKNPDGNNLYLLQRF